MLNIGLAKPCLKDIKPLKVLKDVKVYRYLYYTSGRCFYSTSISFNLYVLLVHAFSGNQINLGISSPILQTTLQDLYRIFRKLTFVDRSGNTFNVQIHFSQNSNSVNSHFCHSYLNLISTSCGVLPILFSSNSNCNFYTEMEPTECVLRLRYDLNLT